MKRILLFILLFVLPKFVFGQMIVEDPALVGLVAELNAQTTASQAENTVEFIEQTETLKTTLEFMKSTREKLSKVNASLNTVIYYQDITKRQLTIIKRQMDYLSAVNNDKHLTAQDLKDINDSFGSILSSTNSLLDLSKRILTDLQFDMGDAERLEALAKINDEMSGMLAEVVSIENNYDYLRKERALQEVIQNW